MWTISPIRIIKNHIKVLNDDLYKFWILIMFIGIPSLISFLLVYHDKLINGKLINLTVLSLSILVGFTINVTTILLKNIDNPKKLDNVELLNNLYYNNLFEILLGILLIIYSILLEICNYPIIMINSFVYYYFIIFYFLTLLIIVRSFNAILEDEIQEFES